MKLNAAWRSGPLALTSFRLLTAGQLTSNIGDYCYAVALPWLVLSDHGSTVLLGALLACYGVPRTALIPVGGILADKISPRTTMLVADGSRCVFVAAFTVLAARSTVSLAALGPLAALIGAGEGLFIPASFAILPSLLDSEALMAGNAFFGARPADRVAAWPSRRRRPGRGLRPGPGAGGRRGHVRPVGADARPDPSRRPSGRRPGSGAGDTRSPG